MKASSTLRTLLSHFSDYYGSLCCLKAGCIKICLVFHVVIKLPDATKCVYVLDTMQLSTNQSIQRLIVSKRNMCHGKFLICLSLDNFHHNSSLEQMRLHRMQCPHLLVSHFSFFFFRRLTMKWVLWVQVEISRSVTIAAMTLVEV